MKEIVHHLDVIPTPWEVLTVSCDRKVFIVIDLMYQPGIPKPNKK